ncbi:MAG: alpha/beta hydrolase [Chitinophagales bacterium]|nr:alpha/beta hydrolase [Chitinophagales bacterium]
MQRAISLLILLLGLHMTAIGNPFNSEDWWNRLVCEESPAYSSIGDIDTSIVVVSNRAINRGELRFMSEHRNEDSLYYFFVYAYKGKWHVLSVTDLTNAISHIPNKTKDWVIYTEGMGKIFTSNLDRGMMMASQYDVNVILLDYPSITTTKKMIGNYFFAIKNAKRTYKYFTPVLTVIAHQKSMGNICGKLSLFCHSMGNHLIRQIARKDSLKSINDKTWVDNLILNAACVPERNHQKWLSKIKFAKNIYINYNADDYVLAGAEVIGFAHQLGRRPQYPVYTPAQYVNFSKLVGQNHSYFLTIRDRKPVNPQAKEYYQIILHGNTIDRTNYPQSSYHNMGVEIRP